jgi:hypothetical protein
MWAMPRPLQPITAMRTVSLGERFAAKAGAAPMAIAPAASVEVCLKKSLLFI